MCVCVCVCVCVKMNTSANEFQSGILGFYFIYEIKPISTYSFKNIYFSLIEPTKKYIYTYIYIYIYMCVCVCVCVCEYVHMLERKKKKNRIKYVKYEYIHTLTQTCAHKCGSLNQ